MLNNTNNVVDQAHIRIVIDAIFDANGEDHDYLTQKLNSDVSRAVYENHSLNGGDNCSELIQHDFKTSLIDDKTVVEDAFKQLEKVYDEVENKEKFKSLFYEFAKDKMDNSQVINKYDSSYNPSKIALLTTFYPQRDNEIIDWSKPLFDSDGYPNTLISMGSFEVVTKCSISFVVWNRNTGECKMPNCEELRIGNTPLSEEDRESRKQEILETLRGEALIERMRC